MTFLIYGLGSIGQRHVRLLRSAMPQCRIVAVQSRRRQLIIHDDLTTTEGDPVRHYKIESIPWEKAEDIKADAGFITNPIAMHAGVLRILVGRGIPAFVEKPLSDASEGLEEVVKRAIPSSYVGYQLRWHPAVQLIKSQLEQGVLGELHSAKIHFGEWLPGTRKYEDYRKTHMALRAEGGGVILCLSHEIDMARFFFGEAELLTAVGGRFSDLEIETEDTIESVICFRNPSGRKLPVSLSLNFLDRPAQRWLAIHGADGVLKWDYHENVVRIFRAGVPVEETPIHGFYRNLMFERQQKHFLACLSETDTPLCSLNDGLRTLDLCVKLQKAVTSLQQ